MPAYTILADIDIFTRDVLTTTMLSIDINETGKRRSLRAFSNSSLLQGNFHSNKIHKY